MVRSHTVLRLRSGVGLLKNPKLNIVVVLEMIYGARGEGDLFSGDTRETCSQFKPPYPTPLGDMDTNSLLEIPS